MEDLKDVLHKQVNKDILLGDIVYGVTECSTFRIEPVTPYRSVNKYNQYRFRVTFTFQWYKIGRLPTQRCCLYGMCEEVAPQTIM